jgi:hypothetical protein
MNQMGQRPGIIILREGTDSSQVSIANATLIEIICYLPVA